MVTYYYFLSVSSILGLFGNTVLMVVLLRKKKTVFEYSILCLSLADGIFSLAMATFGLILIIPQLEAIFSWLMIISGVQLYTVIAVFLLSIFMAIQRFIAVLFPLKCRRILTKKRCIAVLISIWITSAILATLIGTMVLAWEWLGYIMASSCFVMFVVYGAICYNLSRKKQLVAQCNSVQSRQRTRYRRSFVYSFAVAITFTVCVLPRGIIQYLGKNTVSTIKVANIFFTLNPFFDADLYFIINYYNKIKSCCLCKKDTRAIVITSPEIIPPTLEMADRL